MTALAAAGVIEGGKGRGRGGGQRGRGRGRGTGKGKGQRKRGHCMVHQFSHEGCNKELCMYQHHPDQLGRFADVRDSTGKKPCMYHAKLGSCYRDNCEFAHMEVPGAQGERYAHSV